MKDKKKHNLLSKHIIQQVLPIFDELFKTLDEKFEQLNKEEYDWKKTFCNVSFKKYDNTC